MVSHKHGGVGGDRRNTEPFRGARPQHGDVPPTLKVLFVQAAPRRELRYGRCQGTRLGSVDGQTRACRLPAQVNLGDSRDGEAFSLSASESFRRTYLPVAYHNLAPRAAGDRRVVAHNNDGEADSVHLLEQRDHAFSGDRVKVPCGLVG